MSGGGAREERAQGVQCGDGVSPLVSHYGALLLWMALTGTTLQRLPLTTALIYLVVGYMLGGRGLGLLAVDSLADAALLERVTEIAVLIALFTAGLKLRTPLHAGQWALPLRLAVGAMTLTVGLVTLVGVVLLHLPVGAALLLGAILGFFAQSDEKVYSRS